MEQKLADGEKKASPPLPVKSSLNYKNPLYLEELAELNIKQLEEEVSYLIKTAEQKQVYFFLCFIGGFFILIFGSIISISNLSVTGVFSSVVIGTIFMLMGASFSSNMIIISHRLVDVERIRHAKEKIGSKRNTTDQQSDGWDDFK